MADDPELAGQAAQRLEELGRWQDSSRVVVDRLQDHGGELARMCVQQPIQRGVGVDDLPRLQVDEVDSLRRLLHHRAVSLLVLPSPSDRRSPQRPLTASWNVTSFDVVVPAYGPGVRSVAAARAATAAGLGPAYNIVHGFEGPHDELGHRSVAGWKNEGLPWRQG